MHRFAQLLKDSGVDTFAISPNTQIAWYPSKVVPTALDGYTRGDQRWAHWFRAHPPETNFAMMDHYLDLVEAGVDWAGRVDQSLRREGDSPVDLGAYQRPAWLSREVGRQSHQLSALQRSG